MTKYQTTLPQTRAKCTPRCTYRHSAARLPVTVWTLRVCSLCRNRSWTRSSRKSFSNSSTSRHLRADCKATTFLQWSSSSWSRWAIKKSRCHRHQLNSSRWRIRAGIRWWVKRGNTNSRSRSRRLYRSRFLLWGLVSSSSTSGIKPHIIMPIVKKVPKCKAVILNYKRFNRLLNIRGIILLKITEVLSRRSRLSRKLYNKMFKLLKHL